jgi:Na+-driven multidrug efflux pump
MALSIRSIRSSIPGYPCNIFIAVCGGFFVGTGFSIFGTVSQLLRSVVFRVSAAWILSRAFTLDNIWWFQSIAFFLASFVSLGFFTYLRKKLRREFAPRA